MCFVFIWDQTATCATYSINWLVFITEMKSVYSAVRTGSLNKAVCVSSVKGLNYFQTVGNNTAWFQTFAALWTLYSFFWTIPRPLNSMCGRFGTLCSIFIGGVSKCGVNGSNLLAPPVKMELTVCSETSAYKIQTQGNYPEESIQHSEHPSYLSVYEDGKSVPKRLHIKFRGRGFTQKKAYSIQNILHTYPSMRMEQSVPKRLHIKFRRRGITQKKTYNKIRHVFQTLRGQKQSVPFS